LQCAAQPRRAGRLTDPEHAGRALAVEVEQDPQRQYLALRRGQPGERRVELRGEALAERRLLRIRALQRVTAFAASPPLLRAKMVERRRARELAEPGASAPAARVEPAPALERPGERLCCQVFGHVAVSGQVDEERVHVVEVA